MKKVIVAIAALAVAFGAFADWSVDLNVGYGISGSGDNGGIVDNIAGQEIVIQLWSVGVNGVIDYAAVGSSTIGGDGDDVFIGAYSDFATGTGDFSSYAYGMAGNLNSGVGGGNISDSVFARVIGAGGDGITAGDEFFDSATFTLSVLDLAAVPAPTPDSFVIDDSVAQTATGTMAVPEPATIGLFGIGGFGAFLLRRKAKRA